jgi:hypothetical protein
MLAVFGTVADRALLDQARLAGEAALSEAGEKARLTAASVRAAIAEVDQNVPARQEVARSGYVSRTVENHVQLCTV